MNQRMSIEADHTLPDGRGDISVTISINLWRENYGEDADGNRGVEMDCYEIDDYETYYSDTGEDFGEELDDDVLKELVDKYAWEYV